MTVTDYTAVLNKGALETYSRCTAFLAHTWGELDANDPAAVSEWEAMRSTLYESLLHVLMIRNEHDGDVQIFADGAPEQMSFYWRYASGYHGGIIFHRKHQDGVPTKVGTWTIHT